MMADIDEDPPINSQANNDEDNDPDDETQDFLLLASLTSKSGHQIPKRGEKDFERHGTKHQDGKLAASRQAMHDALDYTRIHTPKAHVRGFYYGIEGLQRDEVIEAEWRQGLDEDHVVLVENPKGQHFKTIGKSTTGKRRTNLWLLPEEALYLVERGNLDLWWPSQSSFRGFVSDEPMENEENNGEEDEGVPMSLQAAYSVLIGNESETGKIRFEKYAVYANLKRAGCVVMRASSSEPTLKDSTRSPVDSPRESSSIFFWLFGLFAEEETKHPTFGPLFKPGMYRSYNSIYRQFAIIPRYKPTPSPKENLTSPPQPPFAVFFELWKATKIPTFSKSNPGLPDFRLAITDARSSSVPTLKQMTSLLESTPWDPPLPTSHGPLQLYQRLQKGYRNVILAVVDQGVISYLRMGEAAFGEERLYEGFDRSRGPGAKRGGGMSRGGAGRGRGRGRGRGGGLRGRGQK